MGIYVCKAHSCSVSLESSLHVWTSGTISDNCYYYAQKGNPKVDWSQHKEGKMHWANSPIHGNKVTKQPTDRDHYLCAHHNTL